MLGLPLPHRSTDELKLADWLELHALRSDDRNSSIGNLERALNRATVFNPEDNIALESKCVAVLNELQQRVKSADMAYPFEIDGSLLRLRANPEDFTAYVFCLCLSFFGWENKKGRRLFPDRLFEELSCIAARNFTGGEVVKFGFPRQDLPKGFAKAVDKLCLLIGECTGFKHQPLKSVKDYGLDVVAWRNFPDGFPSKLILFGQCATGIETKRKNKEVELQPHIFCQNWLMDQPVSPLIKAYFTPHRTESNKWEHLGRKAGIIFDRCRIAYLVHRTENLSKSNPYLEWIMSVLEKVEE